MYESLAPEVRSEIDELLSPYEGRERISLRELGERLGLNADARSRLVKQGLIRPTGREGLGGGYVLDEAEARRLIIAVLKAAAVGVAVVTVLRVLGASGAPR